MGSASSSPPARETNACGCHHNQPQRARILAGLKHRNTVVYRHFQFPFCQNSDANDQKSWTETGLRPDGWASDPRLPKAGQVWGTSSHSAGGATECSPARQCRVTRWEDQHKSRQGRLIGSSEEVLLFVCHVVGAQQGPILVFEGLLLMVSRLVLDVRNRLPDLRRAES